MTRRTAMITGIRGQDGSYLAELLDAQGYALVGTSHDPDSSGKFAVPGGQVAPLEALDLSDQSQIEALLQRYRPDEIYNLAARSSSAQLFDDPLATAEINGVAAVRFLEAIRQLAIEQGRQNAMFVHLTLVPYLSASGEIKTKPTQHSVKELRSIGIQPDLCV